MQLTTYKTLVTVTAEKRLQTSSFISLIDYPTLLSPCAPRPEQLQPLRPRSSSGISLTICVDIHPMRELTLTP
jgi:hypothetical protein